MKNETLDTPIDDTALVRWQTFTDFLDRTDAWDHIGTEDVVAALIDRSLLEERLESIQSHPAAVQSLFGADLAFRRAAPQILENTEIALFKDDEPPTHWWWHVEQLVLGESGEQLLAVPEAAKVKGVHPHTVRSAVKDGRLPARRLARGFLIHRRDLERWQPRVVGRPKGSRSPKAADTLLESYDEANTSGDWQRAQRLAEAMERDPTSPRRSLAVAITAFNLGDNEKAERWAVAALEGDLPRASRQTALLVQGRALLSQDHPRKALRVLESARGLGFSDWLIDAALADAYLESAKPKKAVEVAERALAEAPDVPETRYQLARMQWHANDAWGALENVIRFRTSRPDEPDAILLHGSILGWLGDRTGQTELYEQARTIVEPLARTGTPEALSIDGQALGSLGRWRPAVRVAKSIMKMPDEDGALLHRVWHIARAAVDASMSNDDAADVISAFRKLLGDDDYLMEKLAFVRAAAGDVDGVLDVTGVRMSQLAEADDHVRLVVAFALLVSGRGAEAYPLFESLEDQAEELYPALVESALAAGDVDGAREALHRLASAEGPPARVAAIAMKLLERIERADYAATFGALVAGTRSPGLVWHATTTVVQPQASESTWEGVHRHTSSVMVGLTRTSLN